MLVGFKCPQHGEEPGRENKFDYCIHECSNPCVAPHVLASLLDDPEWRLRDERRVSVTWLTGGCKRKTLLERVLPFYAEPNDRLALFRGKLIHSLVEDCAEAVEGVSDKWIIEAKMELPMVTASGEWMLVGKLDAGDIPRKTLYDIKTFQDYAIMKMVTGTVGGTWSEHYQDQYVLQLNIYRYMAREVLEKIFERLRLQMIGFGQFVITGADEQIVTIKKGFKQTKDPYTIPDIPILPDEVVTGWIEEEGEQWIQILYEGRKAPIRDIGWEWLCKYCQFYQTKHCPDPEAEAKTEVEE